MYNSAIFEHFFFTFVNGIDKLFYSLLNGDIFELGGSHGLMTSAAEFFHNKLYIDSTEGTGGYICGIACFKDNE